MILEPVKRATDQIRMKHYRPLRGLRILYATNLGLTPQALCFRPLRGQFFLSTFLRKSHS